MQTVYNKLQTTGYTFKNKNVKLDFLQIEFLCPITFESLKIWDSI